MAYCPDPVNPGSFEKASNKSQLEDMLQTCKQQSLRNSHRLDRMINKWNTLCNLVWLKAQRYDI